MKNTISSIPITLSDLTRSDLYYYLGTIATLGQTLHTDFYPNDCRATVVLATDYNKVAASGKVMGISEKTRRKYVNPLVKPLIQISGDNIALMSYDEWNRLMRQMEALDMSLKRKILTVRVYTYFYYWCSTFSKGSPFHTTMRDAATEVGTNVVLLTEVMQFLLQYNFIERLGTYCFGNERNVSYKYVLPKNVA